MEARNDWQGLWAGQGPGNDFHGAVLDAEEALHTGLVSRVVPPAELMPQASAMARDLALKEPSCHEVRQGSRVQGGRADPGAGLRLEADLYFLLHTTEDRTEGVKAFREKRPPALRGSIEKGKGPLQAACQPLKL